MYAAVRDPELDIHGLEQESSDTVPAREAVSIRTKYINGSAFRCATELSLCLRSAASSSSRLLLLATFRSSTCIHKFLLLIPGRLRVLDFLQLYSPLMFCIKGRATWKYYFSNYEYRTTSADHAAWSTPTRPTILSTIHEP